MSKNCIITTVKSKIKGNATSFIERETEIIIPVSNKFTLSQTRAIAISKVNKINKEYLSEKFGEVVSLNSSYTDGTGINIHPSQRLVDAYEVKEGNKTIEEVNRLDFFNGDVALYEQELKDFENEANLIRFSDLRQELRVQEGKLNFKNGKISDFEILSENLVIDKEVSQQQAQNIFNKKNKTNQDKKDLSIYFANYFLNSIYDKKGLLHLGYTRFLRYGITPPKLLIVKDNERKNPFFQYNNVVIIGLDQIEDLISAVKTTSFEKFENLINTVAQEEIIHLYADYILDHQDIDNIYNEMTEKDIEQIKKIYGNSSIQKENIVHEYVRMVVQQRVFGKTTEYETFTLSNAIMSFFENLLERLNDFLSTIIGSTNTQKAIEDVINFTKGNFSKELDDKIVNRVFNKGQILEANLNVLNNFQEEQKELDKIIDKINNESKQLDLFEDNDRFYQIKNIFNSVTELETKLKSINKTPNSIGSDSKIDDVLKKAGIESELRAQFIQLLKENPSLKSLKLSNILSSYLKEFIKDSDRQFYKAIDEPLSNELESILIEYFDKFHIRKQELDNLKEKFGVDSIGVFDVLAKTVYYSKNRNLLTLPEEYGHVFVELLGSIGNKKSNNPLFKYMFDNIESWDGYKRVFRDYKDKYVTAEGNIDIYKIKKEAIGQAIGIALVRNYKVQKGDTGFWSKVQEVIDYILNLIQGVDYVSLNTTIDSIAKDILSKNYSKLDRLNKDTSNYNLLSYSETIKQQNAKDGGKALKFMQWFSEKGMIITGSLAYRLQGNVYRPEIDALHDIDNIVPSNVHNLNLNKSNFLNEEQLEKDKIYRKLVSEGKYKEAKQYKVQGNLKLDLEEIVNQVDVLQDFKREFPDTDFLYSFFNQKANAYYVTINAIWSENKELRDRFKSYSGSFNDRLTNFTEEELSQIYLFDFFLRPESSEEYKQIKDKEYNLNLAHFNYSFYEKLNMMGRAKDAYDYQMWDYFDENNILAPDFNDRLVYFQLNQSRINSNSNNPNEGIKYSLNNQQNNSFQQFQESLNKPNTNPILQGNQTNIEEIITQLEKDGLLEIDCKGKLKAEKGLATSFVKGGKWKIIKDLKNYPTHKQGGVDLTIGKNGVSIKNGNTQFTAKHGLVIPSWINPKNWGVTDYSDKGDFNTAYSTARKAGEKEFLFNGKRYNTNYKGTPQQQLKETGLTNEQIQDRSKLNKNLTENIYPYSYNNLEKRIWTAGVLGEKEENRKAIDKDPKLYDKEKLDALNLYAGVPQKNNTFKISNYKPSTSKDNIIYYTFNKQDDKFVQNLLDYAYLKSKGSTDGSTKGYDIGVKGLVPDQEKNVMGNYKMSTGKDDRGSYVSFYDKWDLAPTDFGKPFEIYDRIYTKDYGDGKQKRMYYTDKELSKLDINKKDFDTLALQRELSNRGYKLPKSTKQDGSFDGIWGDETKNALLEYRKSQNKSKN